MTGILATQVSTPIIGQAAWILGKIMDGIYKLLYSLFGIQNLGLCIILLTIIIYTLLLPLTVKQQKFAKMSAAMGPEIQKVQKKYQGKKDQASMQKMQEETNLIYQKYGISPTGGCLNMFIQLPFLWAMWYVIRGIPAYVGQVKEVYQPLAEAIQKIDGFQPIMEEIGKANPIAINPSKFDYSTSNVLIDVIYKFQASTWNTLTEKFPDLSSLIESTKVQVSAMTNFFGLNIAETPSALLKSGWSGKEYGVVFVAILIPILAGATQFLSVKITSATTSNPNSQNDQMAATMKSMNIMFPLMSLVMAFTLPTGLGIYWITSAVVRTVQMLVINKQLSKIPMDELIAKNLEKAEAKRKNKNEVEAKQLNESAHRNVRNIRNINNDPEAEKEREEKLAQAQQANAGAKAGSLADKANMVRKFNEANKK